MSALTLLAFLFFINLLQTCIQESMAPTGTAMLMMVAANRSRPFVRPKRDMHQYQETDIDALPGRGVYWDTNILIRQKGDPGANGSTSEQTRPEIDMDGEDTSNIVPDDEEATPIDYEDYQDTDLVPQPKARSETGDKLLATTNDSSHKRLHVTGNELTQQEDGPLGSEGHPSGHTDVASTSADHNYAKYQQDNQHHEFRPIWDYYQEDDYDSTAGPGDGGSVGGNIGLNLGPFMNFGNYAWSAATSISKRIQSSVMVDQCYELLVCEAHRVGSAWGDSGMLLASGLSELMMWLYGADGEHRRLITEAVTTGTQRQSCWVQMQQCEDKSRDRSLLPFVATVLERFF